MLSVENLTGGYGSKEVVNNITFSIQEGEVLCILGPNGCGKSTLLKLLLRFMPKKSGQILMHGSNIEKLNRKVMARMISYIPQSDYMPFPYTILEMVTMGRSCYLGKWKNPTKEDVRIAYDSLEKLRIQHLSEKLYTQISGGERQLVLIARALCQDTKIIIMDEPTASLDFFNQQLIMDAISTAVQEKKSVVLTTHSPSQPFTIATKALLLSQGSTVGFGDPLRVLTSESLEHVYGIPMDIVTIKDRNFTSRNICLPVH
ncbi:MAG TPA: ABC transporter ATP-binding protein [Anaerovoracaceae bacterium]|nr:ABC transporter ATP-binding protein [Anaerovoracaceae bacterium]